MGRSPRSGDLLAIMPSLPGRRRTDGSVVLTRKLLDGALEMAAHWGGPIRLLVEPWDRDSDNLDNIAVRPQPSTDIRVTPFAAAQLVEHLDDVAVVLASVSHRQNHVADFCARRGIACVYVAEYTLRTRFDIVRAETRNPVLWARRYLWEATQERRQRRALRLAAGVQCNGTPTYDQYRALTPRPHLFFDTRAREGSLIALDALATRLRSLTTEGGPLRLVFSGRFLPYKGVQHLPALAAALRRTGVDATLDLCGDGQLMGWLRAEIARLGLNDRVRLRGTLDFTRELTPFMQREVDLFVCPHLQGDPSSTFSEVFAAGVPIAGFASEALVGMVRHAGAGWTVPMSVPALAQLIGKLARERELLAAAARRARAFAALHTFERTTAGRIQHLRECTAALRRAAVDAGA